MINRGLALVVLVVALLLPGVPAGAGATWGDTWSDEFDGVAGAAPDSGRWGFNYGTFRDEELQVYTGDRANSRLDGEGNLLVEARRETDGSYTSARLITEGTFAQKYGRLTARIQAPAAQGAWPAFWALSEDNGPGTWPATGELDIMDNFGAKHRTDGGPIGPKASTCTMAGADGAWFGGSHYDMPGGAALSGGFHVYEMHWYPDHISNWVDGRPYSIVYKADVLAKGCAWPFDRKFWLLLNVAVGGLAGTPDAAAFPARMLVDYVRVSTPEPPATAATGPIVGRGTVNKGRCVDNSYSSTADRNPVKTTTCKGNTAQQWTVHTDGTIRVQGRCLDVRDSGTWVNALVQIHTCVEGAPSQYWRIASNGTIVNRQANLCLAGDANELQLTMQNCGTAKLQSELWTVPVPQAMTGWWPLAETAGDTRADRTAANRTLTCAGDGACQSVAPAIDTTAAYSVSAWARLNAGSRGLNRTVASQDGTLASGFYLQYNAQFDQWAMSLPLTDTKLPQFSLAHGGTVREGQWTLLTGTIDPMAKQIVLYVDGVRAGSAPISATWAATGATAVGRGLWE